MILMLLWNTNNKMATPAPVQLQQPVMVSDLVCCVFVYGVAIIRNYQKLPEKPLTVKDGYSLQ